MPDFATHRSGRTRIRGVAGRQKCEAERTPRQPLRLAAVVATLLSGLLASGATAQVVLRQFPQVIQRGTPSDATVLFREDRNLNRALDRAREEIANAAYGDAVKILLEVLNVKEDSFYRGEGESANRVSVKAEARRLLGTLPAEGREQFELLCGSDAKRLLSQAIAEGNEALLAETVARYFHTQAGYQAMWLLAQHHRDQGQPLAAALCLRQLLDAPPAASQRFQPQLTYLAAACWYQAGFHNLAVAELESLRQQLDSGFLELGGARRALFAEHQDPLVWLAGQLPQSTAPHADTNQWLVHRGDAARNQSLPLQIPVISTAWRAPFYDEFVDPTGESGESHLEAGLSAALAEVRQLFTQQGEPLLPAAQPLVVGNTAVFRTATQLLAVDLTSGKRQWTGAVDPALQNLLRGLVGTPAEKRLAPRNAAPAPNPIEAPVPATASRQLLLNALLNRVASDACYGGLCSDGSQVFVIEDIGIGPATPSFRVNNGVRQAVGQRNENTLRAYEVRSGKLIWELGGPKSDVGLELAGAWFLGPPLPLAGRLYVLAEVESEIRLLAIDASLPEGQKLLWSQSLCLVEQSFPGDDVRRRAGVSPSFADGVLVCPTGAGAAVAVDLNTRSLLWAYTYPAEQLPNARQQWIIRSNAQFLATPGWADASATVEAGRVLLTPPGSSKLFCVNLTDGADLWPPIDRGDGLYVGGVSDGLVVVVGADSIRALQLDNGRLAWSTRLPHQRQPAGRGYLAGSSYVVPLNDGSLAQVQLDSGDLVARTLGDNSLEPKWAGNLVAVGNRVLSLSLESCDAHQMVSPSSLEARLAANNRDAEAWMLRGDIELQQNNLVQAVNSLRNAVASGGQNRARDLLAQCLLRMVQADFSQHRPLCQELETHLVRPATAARYWRIVAEGLAAQQDSVGALRAYLRLADQAADDDLLQDLSPSLQVRPNRLVQHRMAELWNSADRAQRVQMDEVLGERLAAALASEDPASLRLSIERLGWHPRANELRWQLAQQLQAKLLQEPSDASPLEWESVLLQFAAHGSPADRAEALASLAAVFARQNQADPAVYYAHRLRQEFPDQQLGSGQRGADFAAQLLSQPSQIAASEQRLWPQGKVTGRAAAVQIPAKGRSWGVHQQVTSLDQFPGRSFLIENQSALVVRNAERELWRTRFIDPQTNDTLGSSPQGHSLGAHGHLLVLTNGCYVLGIDSLGKNAKGAANRPPGLPADDAAGQIRWVHPLTDNFPGMNPGRMYPLPIWEAMPWGETLVQFQTHDRIVLGSMKPVVGSQVTFLRGNELVSVDTVSGATLWIRGNIEAGSELFGNERQIYVVGRSARSALVFRTADGEPLGERPVPPPSQRMRSYGNRLLTWHTVNQQTTVRLFDVDKQEDVWSHTFDASARAAFASDGRLGVLEKGGHFQLLDPPTGEALISANVDAMSSLAALFVLKRSDGGYVVAATRSLAPTHRQQDGWVVRPLQNPSSYDAPAIDGFVHGFDANGRLSWSQPARDLALPLHQPEGSPMLCFLSYLYGNRMVVNGRQMGVVQQSCVTFLDKRTGSVVYRQTLAGVPSYYELTASAAKKTVEFSANVGTVRLDLTDEPPAAADPKEVPLEPEIIAPAVPQQPNQPQPALPQLPVQPNEPMVPMPPRAVLPGGPGNLPLQPRPVAPQEPRKPAVRNLEPQQAPALPPAKIEVPREQEQR